MKHLAKISLFILLTAIYAVGQSAEQSRLNIGVTPKVPQVSSKVTPLSFAKVENEVSINKRDAVLDFYKQILLNPKVKPTKPSIAITPEAYQVSESSENLFSSKDISVRNIYPNPANDRAYIEYNLKSSSVKAGISFHNLLGNSVATYDLDSFDRKLDILTRDWEDGIYFYQLTIDGKKVATKKLLVRHN